MRAFKQKRGLSERENDAGRGWRACAASEAKRASSRLGFRWVQAIRAVSLGDERREMWKGRSSPWPVKIAPW